MKDDVSVIIAASGISERFGLFFPKQFVLFDGDFLIRKVVRVFLSIKEVSSVTCVIPENFIDLYNEIFDCVNNEKLKKPSFGGKTRQDSVRNALFSIENLSPKYVLIHDAARCFVDKDLIEKVIQKLLSGSRAVVPVINCLDSVRINELSINRDSVKFVQTPQGFSYDYIKYLHKKYANISVSDDASLVDLENEKVDFVDGNIENKKVTYMSDIKKENSLMFKTGFGFDAHCFSKDFSKKLILSGVEIQNHCGLEAVSDGDVVIHSLVDAILGALKLGSIGEFFDPSDTQWKNADSRIFLDFARKKLMDLGYSISNIDITIVCESPRISVYRSEMEKNIADTLKISIDQVNIKGTTTEKMGFTGRKEGIASYASVLVYK